MEIVNRKARHDYTVISEIEAGIELVGTEINSIRLGNANINDCYGRIKNNEVFLINMFISRYEEGNRFNHDERRERKLLLHKREIIRLDGSISKNKYTLVFVSGTCRGADMLGERFAAENGYEIERYPADWKRFGKSAGFDWGLFSSNISSLCFLTNLFIFCILLILA